MNDLIEQPDKPKEYILKKGVAKFNLLSETRAFWNE